MTLGFRKFYKVKIDRAKEAVDKMFKEGTRIEDDEGIAMFITPIKIGITPKKESVDSMYRRILEKLRKRHLLKYVACYIEDGKVIMEKML